MGRLLKTVDMYRGKIIPESNGVEGSFDCRGSFCYNVSCLDCLHFPAGIAPSLKDEYVELTSRDRRIQEAEEYND